MDTDRIDNNRWNGRIERKMENYGDVAIQQLIIVVIKRNTGVWHKQNF